MNFYENFETPATGECFEYELIVNCNKTASAESIDFGFSSGEYPVLYFRFQNGKVYDNDGNFVHHFNVTQDDNLEIYGNVFEYYHNYFINRIPINSECSKEAGNYIDRFFYSSEDLEFYIRCYDSKP